MRIQDMIEDAGAGGASAGATSAGAISITPSQLGMKKRKRMGETSELDETLDFKAFLNSLKTKFHNAKHIAGILKSAWQLRQHFLKTDASDWKEVESYIKKSFDLMGNEEPQDFLAGWMTKSFSEFKQWVDDREQLNYVSSGLSTLRSRNNQFGESKKAKKSVSEMHMPYTDHEVAMSHADTMNLAQNARELYRILQSYGEAQGLPGWVQEKIILANDYIESVIQYMREEQVHKSFPHSEEIMEKSTKFPR